jgi:hypothetical protein
VTLPFDLQILSKKSHHLLSKELTFRPFSGDKRPDYLCMQPNGQTVGFLNMGLNNWVNVGQVKKSEGWDRANIQFADANGKLYFPSFPPTTVRLLLIKSFANTLLDVPRRWPSGFSLGRQVHW